MNFNQMVALNASQLIISLAVTPCSEWIRTNYNGSTELQSLLWMKSNQSIATFNLLWMPANHICCIEYQSPSALNASQLQHMRESNMHVIREPPIQIRHNHITEINTDPIRNMVTKMRSWEQKIFQ